MSPRIPLPSVIGTSDSDRCRQSRYSDIKNIPQRTASGEVSAKPAPAKDEQKPLPVPSADQAAAAASSSKIDINANPVYPAAGKPITQVNIDTGKLPPLSPPPPTPTSLPAFPSEP